MKASELRIGNWVRQSVTFEEIQITHKILGDEEMFNMQLMSTPPQYIIQPIPLTEEWLDLKFGFELNEDGYYQKKSEGGDLVFYEVDDGCVSVPHLTFESVDNPEVDENGYICVAKPKLDYCMINGNGGYNHVHQLQNIYHALTGEELTLKESL